MDKSQRKEAKRLLLGASGGKSWRMGRDAERVSAAGIAPLWGFIIISPALPVGMDASNQPIDQQA